MSIFGKSRTATPVPQVQPSIPDLLTPPAAVNIKNLRLPKSLPGQDENMSAMQKHFDQDGLELAVREGAEEKRGLGEREKMFLVSARCDAMLLQGVGLGQTLWG